MDNNTQIERLKAIVVSLQAQLQTKEAVEAELEQAKKVIDESNTAKVSLKAKIEELSQSMLMQVQSNRDTVNHLQITNKSQA